MTKKYRTLLIIVVGIGILAAVLIPDLYDALQKAKKEDCSAAMRYMSTAFFSWLTDQVGAAAAGAPQSREYPSYESFVALPEYPTVEEFYAFLDPSGTRPLPPADCLFEIWVSRDPLADRVIRIRTPGADGVFEDCPWGKIADGDRYSCGDDIVSGDGFITTYPGGAKLE